MMNACSVRRSLMVLFVSLAVAASAAQARAQQAGQQGQQGQGGQFQPQVGQAGKDVVWVPTPQELVDKMLEMAKVTPQDYLIDLGSGDGRTVITAAKRGTRAHGIEYNPDMVALSQANAAKEGVSDKATFEKADLFESDFSKATVITMFLLPSINEKLRPKILDLKPGTRIVSNSFGMGEWQPDETQTVQGACSSWCTAMLWIVPAHVEGSWQLGKDRLTLKQDFQMLSGTLESAGKTTPISDGRMRGSEISFTAGGTPYAGRVDGDTMEGSVSGNGTRWTATKVQ
jgi:hypothetical protein